MIGRVAGRVGGDGDSGRGGGRGGGGGGAGGDGAGSGGLVAGPFLFRVALPKFGVQLLQEIEEAVPGVGGGV